MVSKLLWVGGEYQWVSMWHDVVATGPTSERSAVYLNDILGSTTYCQMETLGFGYGVDPYDSLTIMMRFPHHAPPAPRTLSEPNPP